MAVEYGLTPGDLIVRHVNAHTELQKQRDRLPKWRWIARAVLTERMQVHMDEMSHWSRVSHNLRG